MVGQLIGKHRIVREIGRGGMGAVYEGVHEGIGQRAAIKVLHGRFAATKEAGLRFLNEARVVNLVQHAGLVKVFDFGQLPDGTLYILMEYLEGESLQERLARTGPLAVAAALRIARQVAAALQAAHARGIVHRDLKPANVLLVPDPEIPAGERVKLLDFGIAKVLDASGLQTGSGVIMGTPAYMSPEQCRGSHQVNDRTDVYSLGVMLYQLLAGRLPCPGAAAPHQPPPPLGAAAPWTPPAVARLVHRLLSKDPSARPAMGQVLRRLEALEAEDAGARAHGGGQRTRRTLAVGAVALAVLLLGVGLLGALRRGPPPGDRPDAGQARPERGATHDDAVPILR